MGLELNRVHDYERGPGNTVLMKRINPANQIRYTSDVPPVIVQGGRFYSEGGQEIPERDLPEAFWQAARRKTEESRRECGLVLPEERRKATAEVQEKVRPSSRRKGRAATAADPEDGLRPSSEVELLRSDLMQLAGTVDKLVGAVNHLLAKPAKKGRRRKAA